MKQSNINNSNINPSNPSHLAFSSDTLTLMLDNAARRERDIEAHTHAHTHTLTHTCMGTLGNGGVRLREVGVGSNAGVCEGRGGVPATRIVKSKSYPLRLTAGSAEERWYESECECGALDGGLETCQGLHASTLR